MKDNLNEPSEVEIFLHKEYMSLQRKEMIGEVNLYFAAQKFHRPVSDSEAILHYIEYGGAEDFFHRYGYLICPVSKPNSN